MNETTPVWIVNYFIFVVIWLGANKTADYFCLARQLQFSFVPEWVTKEEALGIMAETAASKFYTAPRWLKHATSFVIYFCNIVNTMVLGMIGPALRSFSLKYDTTVDKVALIMNIMGVCALTGAVFAGVLFRFVPRHAAVVIFFVIEALLIASVPHMPSLTTFYIAGGLSVFTTGIFNTAQIAWMIEIWRDAAGPFILTQHFFSSIGSLLAPLVLGPFLADGAPPGNETGMEMTTVSAPDSTTADDVIIEQEPAAELYIPFAITGGMALMGALIQLILLLVYRSQPSSRPFKIHKDSNSSSQDEPEKDEKSEVAIMKTNGRETWKARKIITILLCCIFIGFCMSLEITTLNFFSLFAQFSDVKLTEAEASQVLTATSIGYSVGRAAGIFIVMKVAPHFILMGNFVLMLAGNTILFVIGGYDRTWLWIGAVCLGVGFSTTFPATFAYLQRYILIDNTISALFLFWTGVMMSVYPLIIGSSVEYHPKILNYCNYANLAVMIVSFALIFKITYVKRMKTRP